MKSDRIISVLLGLVGACSGNPKTDNTDAVVLKALALSAECSEDAENEIISEIIAEKTEVAPNCALCAMPCGNTSDYDMNRIYNADELIRNAKLRILTEIRDIASYLYGSGERTLPEMITDAVYKALAYIGYDIDERYLTSALTEVEEINRQIRSNENA